MVERPQVLADIRGGVSGLVAVGSENFQVQVGDLHGSVVNVVAPGAQPPLRPRPLPVAVLPRKGMPLVGRSGELRAVAALVAAGQAVDLHGPAGVGKTSVARELGHHHAPGSLPDGVAYLSARSQRGADVLQSVFDVFYESDLPYKATDGQLREHLRERRALLVVDDVAMPLDEVTSVLDAVPACGVLLASEERVLWGDGRALELSGLPLDDAVALVERELGRPLRDDERPGAVALCTRLGGHPLRILRAVAAAEASGRPLDDVRTPSFDERDRDVLALLAALRHAVAAADVAAVTGHGPVDDVLDRLAGRHLVERTDEGYAIAAGVDVDRDDGTWRQRAIAHFTSGRGRRRPTIGVALVLLAWAGRAGKHAEVVRLARLVEPSVVVARRWGTWPVVLDAALAAARAAGDRDAEAWALHEQGTRALLTGDHAAARAALREAQRLRVAIGDPAAVAVTAHNLDLVPWAGAFAARRRPGHRRRRRLLPGGPAAVVVTALLLAVGAAAVADRFRDDPVVAEGGDPGEAGGGPTTGGAGDTGAADGGITLAGPDRLDFGPQPVRTVAPARDVVLRNGSDDVVTLGELVVDGDADDVAVVADGCGGTSVGPGATCTMAVSFAPQTPGAHSAELRVGPSGAAPVVVTVEGVGTDAPASLSIEPAVVDFGTEAVGTVSAERTVTLRNDGSGAVRVEDVRLLGADAAAFEIRTAPCRGRDVLAGAVCPVALVFAPTATGPTTSRVVFATGAGVDAAAVVRGTGATTSRDPDEPDVFLMPDVVGLPGDDAVTTLVGFCGLPPCLDVERVEEAHESVPAGDVIRQAPAGASVRPGDGATVVVSLGPAALVPEAPGPVQAVWDAARQVVVVEWAAAGGDVAGYRVYRDDVGRATVAADQVRFEDAEVEPGATYAYSVATVGAGERESARAGPATVAVPLPAPPPLAPPTGLVATATAAPSVQLDWSPSEGATGYDVVRDGEPVASVEATGFEDAGVARGARYTYLVVATAPGRVPAPTAAVEVTVPIVVQCTNLGELLVDWEDVEGVGDYLVVRGGEAFETTASFFAAPEPVEGEVVTVTARDPGGATIVEASCTVGAPIIN